MAEAQIEIALCCMREGALSVARSLCLEALSQLDDEDSDLRALALLRTAIVELRSNRLNDALQILRFATPLFEASTNHTLKGSFHNSFATVLKNFNANGKSLDYMDGILNEYSAASFHFEAAGHVRYLACVENNLAMLCWQVGKFGEAHEHLDRAQALFTRLDDRVGLARVEETRTRVLLAEGGVLKASKLATGAVRVLEKGDHQSILVEAMISEAIALCRLHRHEQARTIFERAVTIAEQAGDRESAGIAAITFLEELSAHLCDAELCSILERARSFLEETQDTALLHRLTECACRVLSIIHTTHPDWTTFSLNETLRRHEARFIEMALEDSGGSVTRAASLLGLPGHQTLSFILNSRHQQLLKARTPIKPRQKALKMISGK